MPTDAETLIPDSELNAALAEIEAMSGAADPAAQDTLESPDAAAMPPAESPVAPRDAAPRADAMTAGPLEPPDAEASGVHVASAAGGDGLATWAHAGAPSGEFPAGADAADGLPPPDAMPVVPAAPPPGDGSDGVRQEHTAGQKKLRFKIGAAPAGPTSTPSAAPPAPAEPQRIESAPPPAADQSVAPSASVAEELALPTAPSALQPVVPRTPTAKRLSRGVERALDALNRPLAWMPPQWRALTGWLSLATLLVSTLALVLLPVVFPHRDALTFLHEKRVALQARSAQPPAAPAPAKPAHDRPASAAHASH